MITFPNAKINLGLNIVERRRDGYHNIETIFYPIPLCDALEIVPSPDGLTSLHCYGRPVACKPDVYLAMRACQMMQRRYDLPPVHIHLYKHIPDGAGLGGGSSDAAHTMLMMCKLFNLRVYSQDLAIAAAALGADCPFFIYNRPMLAHGTGTLFCSHDKVTIGGMNLLVVKPPVSVSTAEAYSRVTPAKPRTPVEVITSWPVEMWDGQLVNDFEPTVFAQHPELWAIKLRLLELGAAYAAMSGSGSAIFGIFKPDADIVTHAVEALKEHGEVFCMKL